jgi:histidinol-phosphate aminotransferase
VTSIDLTWTGNQFLDPGAVSRAVAEQVRTMDLTCKGETWSETAAAAIAGRFGLPSGSVRVAAGATQLIEVALRSYLRGRLVDVIPNFHLAASLSRQEKWPYVPIPVRAPDELAGALEPYLGDSDSLIILSSPRNPLGYQFPVDALGALIAGSTATFLIDEVYADFAGDTALRLVASHPNLIVVRTFSKAWGLANLRIGFAASHCFLDPGRPFRLIPNAVSGIAQAAVAGALEMPEAVEASIEAMRACRARLEERLRLVPGLLLWPSDANYLCLETEAAAAIDQRLRQAGFHGRLLHDLKGYPPDWPQGLRLTVPAERHVDRLVEALAGARAQVSAA